MIRTAELNPERTYRYLLGRQWNHGLNLLTFIMLNPSTADENVDDPTIRRCIGYGQALNFDGLYIVNLFAYRSKNPGDLLKVPDPIGNPNNDYWIKFAIMHSSLVIAAWGSSEPMIRQNTRFRKYEVEKLVNKDIYCLRFNRDGNPSHPLMLPNGLQPKIYKINLEVK
jgi:hypothetical protein